MPFVHSDKKNQEFVIPKIWNNEAFDDEVDLNEDYAGKTF